MSRGIFVQLPEEERKALMDRADSEWPSPREHATKLLVEAIRRENGLAPRTNHPAAVAGRQ